MFSTFECKKNFMNGFIMSLRKRKEQVFEYIKHIVHVVLIDQAWTREKKKLYFPTF